MTITKDEDMPICTVIGYTLKIKKNIKITPLFNEQFNAAKHGDYDCFFDLMKVPQTEFIVQWKDGNIKTDNFYQQSGDCDIAMLHKIEPATINFGKKCFGFYGDIRDPDISDLIFRKCAAFEIALRVQRNKELQNRKLPYSKTTLTKIIDDLCTYNSIPDIERDLLHRGRDFVNMIKGHERKKGVPYFSSWEIGVAAFETAWGICDKYKLKICR
jgi:hypothetical protein